MTDVTMPEDNDPYEARLRQRLMGRLSSGPTSVPVSTVKSSHRSRHEQLSASDLQDIVANVRVRLAGWRDCERVDWADDVARFRRLYHPFVNWRDQLKAATGVGSLEQDE